MENLILLGILLGFLGWIIHYIFIISAMFSKEKWVIWVDYNKYHEGYLEVIMISIIIVLYIIIIILTI